MVGRRFVDFRYFLCMDISPQLTFDILLPISERQNKGEDEEKKEKKKRSEHRNHISVYTNYKEFIITTVHIFSFFFFFLSENYSDFLSSAIFSLISSIALLCLAHLLE